MVAFFFHGVGFSKFHRTETLWKCCDISFVLSSRTPFSKVWRNKNYVNFISRYLFFSILPKLTIHPNFHTTTPVLTQPTGGAQRIFYPAKGNFYHFLPNPNAPWQLEYLPTFTIICMINACKYSIHGAYGQDYFQTSFDAKQPTPTLKVKGTRPERDLHFFLKP